MKIGFIGCGNMASAMIGGILRQGIFSKDEIIVSNLTEEGERAVKKLLVLSPLWITMKSGQILQKLSFLQ